MCKTLSVVTLILSYVESPFPIDPGRMNVKFTYIGSSIKYVGSTNALHLRS